VLGGAVDFVYTESADDENEQQQQPVEIAE